jgi:hypothetical protein
VPNLRSLLENEAMRACVSWTPALDGRLRVLRAAGLTWDQVAAEMRLGRYIVLERGRRIGVPKPRRSASAPLAAVEPADRPTRPAGHPETWGLINEGTVLAGTPYPYPVFL